MKLKLTVIFRLICIVILQLNVEIYSSIAGKAGISQSIRNHLTYLSKQGLNYETLNYLQSIEKQYGTLLIDNELPSLYGYKAVALYDNLQTKEAIEVLKTAVKMFPKDIASWNNLGEIQIQTFALKDAIESFEKALELGGSPSSRMRLIRTYAWGCSWEKFEATLASIESNAYECFSDVNSVIPKSQPCPLDSSGGLEYTDVPGKYQNILGKNHPNSKRNEYQINQTMITQRILKWNTKQDQMPKRLKIGLISSDFGIHPVATLLRGFIEMIDKTIIELFCFALNPLISWWGEDISKTVEHMVWLHNMNQIDAANVIANSGIEVLIDLNGHTMFSGLKAMSHLPAPVQISFLGLPTTTSADFIHYFVGDVIASPPEQSDHFSEKLLLLPRCYIVNDYAQVQGDVLKYNGSNHAARNFLNTTNEFHWKRHEMESSSAHVTTIKYKNVLVGTLSNSQKMDPTLFQVWMNILRKCPGTQMIIMEYLGHQTYRNNILRFAATNGIKADRIIFASQTGWIDHLHSKTAIDLMLDTVSKNGHTTGLDGIWAGVPTITLGSGKMMPSRAGESIALTLGTDYGVVYSLQEYEDLACCYINYLLRQRQTSDPRAIKGSCAMFQEMVGLDHHDDALPDWREITEYLRIRSPLFDTLRWTRDFTHLMQATWEMELMGQRTESASQRYHIILSDDCFNSSDIFPSNIPSNGLNDLNELDHYMRHPVATRQIYDDHSYIFRTGFKTRYIRSINECIDAFQDVYSFDLTKVFRLNPDEDVASIRVISGQSVDQLAGISSKNDSHPGCVCESPVKNDRAIELKPIPDYVFDGRLIMLNIGGIKKVEGWLIVNAQEVNLNHEGKEYNIHSDVVRNMTNLEGFPNRSVSAIYSSHTLEHNSFGDHSLRDTLNEWFRVMRIGGLLLVAVPDITTLAKMFLDPILSYHRWNIIKMMYGAQVDQFDYHKVGFDFDILKHFLTDAGFCEIERVSNFNLGFTDTSDAEFYGYHISLNVVARKCPIASDLANGVYDGFSINHNASPYQTV